MPHTKKAKELVDSNNENTNTTPSTSIEPNHNQTTSSSLQQDCEGKGHKIKSRSLKGKEEVIEPSEDITTQQRNHKPQQETDQQQQKGSHLFPRDPIICQLIQAANLFEKLGLKDITHFKTNSQTIFTF
eukprot:TRINITY_DN6682_c0_g1_i3.p1 TRINITY_DN6682_c0_g1~~TRINITY_DN6682_c0_g1_i3.p1  ORF type:complete len:129 (+),score=44.25 TRINITY_DN6682_c0_g1_i3:555-941(+)